MNTKELLRQFAAGEKCFARANLSGADLSGAWLVGANLSGAKLYGANLSGAKLSGAKLSGARLIGANLACAKLTYANLQGAKLIDANLFDANLQGANLQGANLQGADLQGANLRDCIGDGVVILTVETGVWRANITRDVMWIGCQGYTHARWANFSDSEIAGMDDWAAVFWSKHKDELLAKCKQHAEKAE